MLALLLGPVRDVGGNKNQPRAAPPLISGRFKAASNEFNLRRLLTTF